jgi:hypothetical protein
VRVTLRCPYTPQLLLASHPLLFARALGDRSSRVETIKHVITSPLLWMVVVGVVAGCYGWLRRREDEPYGVITMVGGGTLLIGSLIGSFVWLLVTSDLARFHIKVAILIACAAAVLVSVLLIQEEGTVALVSFLVLAVTVPLRLVIGVSQHVGHRAGLPGERGYGVPTTEDERLSHAVYLMDSEVSLAQARRSAWSVNGRCERAGTSARLTGEQTRSACCATSGTCCRRCGVGC